MFSDVEISRQGAMPENGDQMVEGLQLIEASDEGHSGLMDLLLQPLPAGVERYRNRAAVVASGSALTSRANVAETVELVPPYAPYCSWLGLLDALINSLPPVVDEAYLAGLRLSDSSIKPLRSALRFLGLVESDGLPTERLQRLIQGLEMGGSSKVQALQELVYHAYGALFSAGYDLKTATMDELRLFFGTMGARGQIQQKCSTFFLNLARDSGLDLPHYLIPPAPPALQRRSSQARPSLEERREWTSVFSREMGILMGIFPRFDIDWPEEKKQHWFRDFTRVLRIAETGEEPRVN